jgi:hypothetical protein
LHLYHFCSRLKAATFSNLIRMAAVSLGTRSGQIVSARNADKAKKIFGIAQQRLRILLDNRVCFKPFLSPTP